MLLYRVFPHLSGAAAGSPGHPEYLHPSQGAGRLDNPAHYLTWYLALEQSAAVGEAFGNLTVWREEMFPFPGIPGARRALGAFSVPDEIPLLDLDDANGLLKRGLRPTQVVSRTRPVTQDWALGVFHETNGDGSRKWHGVRWWSYQRPEWHVVGCWSTDVSPRCVEVEELRIDHPAVVDAAAALLKTRT
jgi:hypothetical protein